MDSRGRVLARRVVVGLVILVQLGFVARAYWSAHDEFGFQMFPESSTWQAAVVRVTRDGRRVPVDQDWWGYRWDDLVRERGLQYPGAEHHADAGLDNQLAFLDAALDWAAANTPHDTDTRYLEADVTYRRNTDAPERTVLRSRDRVVGP